MQISEVTAFQEEGIAKEKALTLDWVGHTWRLVLGGWRGRRAGVPFISSYSESHSWRVPIHVTWKRWAALPLETFLTGFVSVCDGAMRTVKSLKNFLHTMNQRHIESKYCAFSYFTVMT